MKYLYSGFLSLLFASNLFASNLCDSSCNLSITFPDGGSIKAKDDVTIIFGEGGFVNNGSSTISYSVGERLELDDHGSLKFQDGGVFDIGLGGNIKYSEMEINSDGIMALSAVGGDKLVVIDELKFKGRLAVNISSDFEVINDGSLQIKKGLVTAMSSLTFSNQGSVNGKFYFENATLTYAAEEKSAFEKFLDKLSGKETAEAQSESREISGEIYLKTDRQFTVVENVVVATPPIANEPNNDVVDSTDSTDSTENSPVAVQPVDDANSTVVIDEAGTQGTFSQTGSASDASVSVASAGAGISAFSLCVLFVFILSYRLLRTYKNAPEK